MPVTLAVDAMGGDHGLPVTVPAVLSAIAHDADLSVILVGDRAGIARELRRLEATDSTRLRIQHASEVVANDDLPSKALRNKKDSSLRVAIDLVKDGAAQGAVSAGNTGALVATARFVLKTLPGIDRPAMVSAIPSRNGHVHLLDLGANAECTPEWLFQFAVMGSALIAALYDRPRPTVALLNIGSEEIKGNETVKQAAVLLQESSLNYVGFVEGDGIFLSDIDLVVCDGFAGNVALKTTEGVARMIGQFMREEFNANPFRQVAGLAARPALASLARRIDPRRYNGASLLGLAGTVIKSHGSADVFSFANAIRVGVKAVKQDVPTRISSLLERALVRVPSPSPAVDLS